MEIHEETRARWVSEIWSEITATKGARVALAPIWAMSQPAATRGTVLNRPIMTRPTVMPRMPMTSQGRRRPHDQVVRSEICPKMTLAKTAPSAPRPAICEIALVWAALSSGNMLIALTWMATIAGPRRAMKKKSWARR